MRDDYYELLGLKHSATKTEVVKAFRRLSLKLHPDKVQACGGSPESSAQAFAEVLEAFGTLSDRAARHKYDERLRWMRNHPELLQQPSDAGDAAAMQATGIGLEPRSPGSGNRHESAAACQRRPGTVGSPTAVSRTCSGPTGDVRVQPHCADLLAAAQRAQPTVGGAPCLDFLRGGPHAPSALDPARAHSASGMSRAGVGSQRAMRGRRSASQTGLLPAVPRRAPKAKAAGGGLQVDTWGFVAK